MLTVNSVSRTFNNGNTAFRPLSFQTNKGEIIGILGTSGCGKSTLLRVLAGLDLGFDGSVTVDGKQLESVNEKAGFIFQEPRLLPWLNVAQNVTFGLDGGKKEKQQQAAKWLELVGLEQHGALYPKELSGGMAQRVAIARALATEPEMLLLDEPLSALDAFTKMQLQNTLLDIWSKTESTFVLVTHDIDEALYLCDRLLILKGQPGELYREVPITAPRPRARGDETLAEKKEAILQMLDLREHSVH